MLELTLPVAGLTICLHLLQHPLVTVAVIEQLQLDPLVSTPVRNGNLPRPGLPDNRKGVLLPGGDGEDGGKLLNQPFAEIIRAEFIMQA